MVKRRLLQTIFVIVFFSCPALILAEESLISLSKEADIAVKTDEKEATWADNFQKWRDNILKKYGTEFAFVLNTQYQNIIQSSQYEGKGCWAGYYALGIRQKIFLPDSYFNIKFEGGKGKGIDRYTPSFSVFNDDDNEPCWFYIPKLFFEKDFLDKVITAFIGKIDTSTWCDGNRAATSSDKQFLSSAFVNNRAIPFPSKGLGAFGRVKPNDLFYFQAGISNANAVKTMVGLSNAFGGAYFIISELGITPKIKGKQGNYRFILYGDVEKIERMDGLDTQQNDFGFAVSFDQDITDNITLFMRYGNADPNVRKISGFISAGAQIRGILPFRNEDVFGIGFARSLIGSDYRNITPDTGNAETIYESYYNIKLHPFFSVIPNLQYMTNRLGEKDSKDEFVVGARFVVLL